MDRPCPNHSYTTYLGMVGLSILNLQKVNRFREAEGLIWSKASSSYVTVLPSSLPCINFFTWMPSSNLHPHYMSISRNCKYVISYIVCSVPLPEKLQLIVDSECSSLCNTVCAVVVALTMIFDIPTIWPSLFSAQFLTTFTIFIDIGFAVIKKPHEFQSQPWHTSHSAIKPQFPYLQQDGNVT